MKKILEILDKKVNFENAKAHCDVPCGIYDPISAQIAALTVVRMTDLLEEYFKGGDMSAEFMNRASRLIANKEKHAEEVKHDIRVIWGDFIKAEHTEKYPQLNSIVHSIMKLGSETKQHVNREHAVELVEKVNEFAEIFWAIKGMETVKAKAPYAPALELVYRKI
ncbi:MAG: superoxide dismutase, Ni [Fusobacteriales bacterium]|nr:MAG: superoxide dismutase, Ni [Fusobacteriales bacterium]